MSDRDRDAEAMVPEPGPDADPELPTEPEAGAGRGEAPHAEPGPEADEAAADVEPTPEPEAEGASAPVAEPIEFEPQPAAELEPGHVVEEATAEEALPTAAPAEPETAPEIAVIAGLDADREPAEAAPEIAAATGLDVDRQPTETTVPSESIAPEAPAHGHGGMSLPVISRRTFLAAGAAVACGAAGAFAIAQVLPLPPGVDDSPVVAKKPAWTFVADTTKCIGCGLCVAACKAENNVTESAEFARTWIERHLVAADGAVYIDSPEGGINGFPRDSEAPGAADASIVDAFFEPRLCMQCAESPCTAVCPVGATYRTAEGVILVDPRRCIGCGYCVVSCPYGARYIVPAGDRSPAGIVGVADKCTWCYQRITAGRVPACVEVCPVGAREFGDLSDPTSPIHDVLKGKETHPLHPEFGTKPVVLYVGSTKDGKEPA